ncbi:MAG TPA: hypothetical protein VGL87_02695, partial [Steroidobacteraceae bacterium]
CPPESRHCARWDFRVREHELQRLQQKIARLSMPRHMSYRPVLIHAGAIAESIAEQEYFASVIDFGELMSSADTST